MACLARRWALAALTTLALSLLFFPVLSKKSSSSSNPADELATIINQNRTMSKLRALHDNPGLACIALEYIQAYQGQCNKVGPNGEKPPNYEFNQTFAQSCGIEPNTVSDISGVTLACETKYQDASYAFSNLLFVNNHTLATLQNKNQTEFGVGISGYDGGSPYFWCVLFSSGDPNSTFVFTNGKANYQKIGCFSGTGEPCSSAQILRQFPLGFMLASIIGAAILIL